MARSTVLNLMLLAFAALALTLAARAARRTHHGADHLLASRRLDAWSAAFGYVGSATNAWTLVTLAAGAFAWGLAAVWLWGSFIGGALLSLYYIAPRIRDIAASQNVVTLTQIIGLDAGDRMQPTVARCAAFIALSMLSLQVAAVARIGAEWLAMDAGLGTTATIVLGLGVVGLGVAAGGLRAASAFDAVQLIALACCAVLLLVAGIIALDGVGTLSAGLRYLVPHAPWFNGKQGVAAVAVAVGAFAMGLGVAGQPHAMARLIAVKDRTELRRARWLAIALTIALVSLVVLCGWCARVLYDGLRDPQLALYALATRMLPPSLAAALVAALCAALISSVASPLLALASQLSVDLRRPTALLSLPLVHTTSIALTILTVILALYLPSSLLAHGMLPFTALGAAFGPLLLVRLSGKRTRPGSTLGAMWAGFGLTVIFHLLPDAPGNFLEHVLPFLAALGIALTGGERRRNPDRADRAQETVHDRIPI